MGLCDDATLPPIFLIWHQVSQVVQTLFGPYLITKRVAPVAYRLALPAQSKIHNVLHNSLLKAYEGHPPTEIDKVPPYSVDHHRIFTPWPF